MVKLIELSDEDKNNGPEPKKRRRMDSEETQEDEEEEPEPVGEEEDDEGEETCEEFEDEEQVFEEENDQDDEKEVVEDEKSTETVKIDEEEEEEEEEGSKEENKRRFYLTDLELFDCSVCLQRLSVPIVHLCENEHIVCSVCFSSSSSMCTICVPTTSYKRCRILEKILKSIGESCENLKYGCNRPVHYTMKLDHEKYCKYRPCACPVQGCDFLAPSMQLSGHLSINHSDSINRFSFNRLYSISFGHDERYCVLQEMNSGDVFLVRNMKHDIGNMISVNQIGPLSFRSQFSLDLKAMYGKRLSLRLECEIESIRNLFDGPTTRDFLLVPRRYFEGDVGLELQLRISHSGS